MSSQILQLTKHLQNSPKMNWFGTTIKQNNLGDKKVLQFPTKVLELWQCKKCFNVIYQKKSNYSPFDSKPQIETNIELENVNIRLSQCSEQKFMKIGFKNRQFQITNQAKIYCKVCKDDQLLGEFRPEIDMVKVQFHYSLIPNDQNINKTKIIMGRTNLNQLSESQSTINPVKNETNIRTLNKLKLVKKEILAHMMFWFQSKNFKVYQAFIVDSDKKRKDLECMKKFMMQLAPNKKEQDKKIITNRFKTFNSHLSDSASIPF